MAKAHDRVVQIEMTPVAAADTIQVTAVKFFRDRGQLAANTPLLITYSGTGAQTSPAEIEFGEYLPNPSHLRFVFPVF